MHSFYAIFMLCYRMIMNFHVISHLSQTLQKRPLDITTEATLSLGCEQNVAESESSVERELSFYGEVALPSFSSGEAKGEEVSIMLYITISISYIL